MSTEHTFIPWASFLPEFLAKHLQTRFQEPLTDYEQRFPAVVLFADVSGFTAISEALGASGRAGTEELTQVLNDYFGPMIALIRSYGGMIGRFGGDAMTVLFPYTPATHRKVARTAIQCALDMQRRMVAYQAIKTSAGTFRLSMKAGLADGQVFTTVVGDPAYRLEYIIAGSALNRSAEAEHHATHGEVVIHQDVLDAAGQVLLQRQHGAFAWVQALEGARPHAGQPPLLPYLPPTALDVVARFLHPSVAERLRQGQSPFLNEHRLVSVVFVRFQEFDYDHDPRVGAQLQEYFQQVMHIVRKYDGYLNKIDMGDKGSKYIILFGTPIAHENDPQRALHCALELRAIPGVPVWIGVNSGFVFCGQVGSKMRQEYTVIGDAVNLAARLMQSARRNEIVVGQSTFRAARRRFTWRESRTLQVKGKQQSVQAHVLAGTAQTTELRLEEVRYTLPMVGRQQELAQVLERLERARQGQGQVIGLTAEAGMGKSRLAAEVLTHALSAGWHVVTGECYSHATQAPYTVWQKVLRRLFNIHSKWTSERQIAQLQTAVEALAPEMQPRMPLLAQMLHLPLEDNEWTRAMDARLRKEALEGMVVTLIRRQAANEPLLLSLEDTHWIDPLSNDLLEAVARNLADHTAALLVVYRPPETHRVQPRVFRLSHFTEIRLPPFTQAETAELVRLKLTHLLGESVTPPETLVQQIAARAEGNPFFVDELMNYLHDQGIDPRDAAALASLELPASLHQVILSRIDRLSERAKSTLRVASVIGRTFCAAWLWGAYPPLGKPEEVRVCLDELSQLDITPLDKPEPELEYIFKHILTREVTYQSLAVATRAMLHEHVGQYIERTYADTLDSFLDLLAYHYGHSANREKQIEYFRKAGEAARAAYANQTAVDYFQQLLPLLPPREQSEIWLYLAEIWRLTGEWEQALNACEQALTLATDHRQETLQARALTIRGAVQRQRGEYENALQSLQQAQALAQQSHDAALLGNALREIGSVYWLQGDFDRSLEHFQRAWQIARQANDQHGMYRALGNIGVVEMRQRYLEDALSTLQQALTLASQSQDKLAVSTLIGNLGNVYWRMGNLKEALTHYHEQLRLAAEIGAREPMVISIGNISSIYALSGEWQQAREASTYNLALALEIGDRLGVALAAWDLASNFLNTRRLEDAHRWTGYAIAIARRMEMDYDLCDFLYTHAEVHRRQEQAHLALPILEEALRIASEVEHDEVAFKARVAQIALQAAAGQITVPQARDALQALLHETDDPEEQALLHEALWQVDPTLETHRQAAAERYHMLYEQTPKAEYRERYRQLTGEDLPAPPALPPLPDLVARHPVELSSLEAALHHLLAEIGAQQEPCS